MHTKTTTTILVNKYKNESDHFNHINYTTTSTITITNTRLNEQFQNKYSNILRTGGENKYLTQLLTIHREFLAYNTRGNGLIY